MKLGTDIHTQMMNNDDEFFSCRATSRSKLNHLFREISVYCTDIHGPQAMYPNDVGDQLNFSLLRLYLKYICFMLFLLNHYRFEF